LLAVDSLCHSYGDLKALDNVSFSLDPGVTALVGVNGAGKSTLMSAISGAVRPRSGRVSINGFNPYGRDRRKALRLIALMPQLTSFPKNMTTQEVVEYLTWMRGLRPSEARRAAMESIAQVGLGPRARSKVGQLSGGMQRRVGLAQALASASDVVLLDEPSTGLDPEQRRTMVDLIGALDRTVLMSSHVLEDVVEVASRVLVLNAGQIVFDGTVEQLKSLAPKGTEPGKAAEVGFLNVISSAR